ncbi:MAG: hypothetical protein M3R04_00675 [bacterium]|nr:hypothetical protein [bacterium]
MNTWRSLLLAVAEWLARIAGRPLAARSLPPRNRYGRFVSNRNPCPSRDPRGLAACSAWSGAAERSPEELFGISPRTLKAATPLELSSPDDLEATQLELRRWVLCNMERWVERRHCSLWSAFSALKDTWAIDHRSRQVVTQKVGQASLPVHNSLSAGAMHAPIHAARARAASVQGDYSKILYLSRDRLGLAQPSAIPSEMRDGGVPPPPPSQSSEQHIGRPYRTNQWGDIIPVMEVDAGGGGSPVAPPSPAANLQANGSEPLRAQPAESDVSSCNSESTQAGTPVPPLLTQSEPSIISQLPTHLLNRLGSDGSALGYGDSPSAAIDDYLAKAQSDLGPGWRTYTMAPRVMEEFDQYERRYYVAWPGDVNVAYAESQEDGGRAPPYEEQAA